MESVMTCLKSIARVFGEAVLETIEEGISSTPSHDYESVDDFSNSYRLNEQCEVITDFEGDNAPENGGQWLRK